jgi:hypothetical protein
MSRKGGSTGIRILIDLVLFIAILSAFTFLLLPLIYPSLNASNNGSNTPINGIIIQSKYAEFNSTCYVTGDDTSWQMVTDTSLSITIQNQSKILVSFNGMGIFYITSYTGYLGVLINVSIGNAGNRAIFIRHNQDTAVSGTNVYYPVDIEYMTKALQASTYTVKVFWKFDNNPTVPGTQQFFFKVDSQTGSSHLRSLLVQELA